MTKHFNFTLPYHRITQDKSKNQNQGTKDGTGKCSIGGLIFLKCNQKQSSGFSSWRRWIILSTTRKFRRRQSMTTPDQTSQPPWKQKWESFKKCEAQLLPLNSSLKRVFWCLSSRRSNAQSFDVGTTRTGTGPEPVGPRSMLGLHNISHKLKKPWAQFSNKPHKDQYLKKAQWWFFM